METNMETAHDKIRQDKFPMSEQSPENMPFTGLEIKKNVWSQVCD